MLKFAEGNQLALKAVGFFLSPYQNIFILFCHYKHESKKTLLLPET